MILKKNLKSIHGFIIVNVAFENHATPRENQTIFQKRLATRYKVNEYFKEFIIFCVYYLRTRLF